VKKGRNSCSASFGLVATRSVRNWNQPGCAHAVDRALIVINGSGRFQHALKHSKIIQKTSYTPLNAKSIRFTLNRILTTTALAPYLHFAGVAFPSNSRLGHSAISLGGNVLIYAGARDVQVNTTSTTGRNLGHSAHTVRRFKP
jgi:hypothetical protein